MSKFMPMQRFFLAAAFTLYAISLPATVHAADPAAKTIVVVSLIGDEFNVVVRRNQIGTRSNPNEIRRFPVADATFDRMAMTAAELAIEKAAPGTNVLQASIRDPKLFVAQDDLLADSPQSQGLRVAVRELLAKYGATQLVLVTKRRAAASFQLRDYQIGGGMLNGIGFYVDNTTSLVNVGSNEESPGFLSPFAYLTVSLLDASTMRTVKSEAGKEARMSLTVDSTNAVKAWDSLTPEAKVEGLERAITSAVSRATTAVLAP